MQIRWKELFEFAKCHSANAIYLADRFPKDDRHSELLIQKFWNKQTGLGIPLMLPQLMVVAAKMGDPTKPKKLNLFFLIKQLRCDRVSPQLPMGSEFGLNTLTLNFKV